MKFLDICEKLEDLTIELKDLKIEDPLSKMRQELHQKIEKLSLE